MKMVRSNPDKTNIYVVPRPCLDYLSRQFFYLSTKSPIFSDVLQLSSNPYNFMTTLQPGIRWDSTKYELDDFDFNELTGMFSQLRGGCGSNFNSYFGLMKKFVMLTMTNYELDAQAKKFLSAELLPVHERFVYRMIQICDLPVKTRSLDDILSGKEDSRERLFLPHVSTLNAMAILYSLAYGWKAPDKKFGELVANSVHTLLRDRIDAALHVRKVPLTNEIGIHAKYQGTSTDEGGQSKSSDDILYASDFLKSFSNKSHFLGYESDKLLRFRCHANLYKRLKCY
ncbi:unnamed protein product [Cylicocyclus nassatus]|uniref:Uncharacterized protein n=1 Tax=Cylicocyclus nassatus TaxID=53992 RepID=A0AA36H4U7_CYLNA|nr:unnamed protein product [Cylicocyclus nassatus]